MGEPATGPVVPPEPLTPPAPAAVAVQKHEDAIDRIVRSCGAMREAYIRVGCSRHADALSQLAELPSFRAAAKQLLQAGVDPADYTTHVCLQHAKKKGKFPLPTQVFGTKAIEKWLPEYKKAEGQFKDGRTHEAGVDRVAEYSGRMRLDQLPKGKAPIQ